ncbi:MAG: S24/S26 family peptidase [bacterium]
MIKAFRLEGTSMGPLFKTGDTVLAELPPFRPVKGDCVIYRIAGRYLLHRVAAVEKEAVWLADDAGSMDSHRVPLAAITGRVISRSFFSQGLSGRLYSLLVRTAHKTKRIKILRNFKKFCSLTAYH